MTQFCLKMGSTSQEGERLIDLAKNMKNEGFFLSVVLAMYTGMRKGEIRKIKKSWFKEGFIYIPGHITKNGKNKVLPIHPFLQECIDDYLSKYLDFDLEHDYRHTFYRVREDLGIKDLHFHDLRHTYASRLRNLGASADVLMELLGVQSRKIVNRYSHHDPNVLTKEIHKLDFHSPSSDAPEKQSKPVDSALMSKLVALFKEGILEKDDFLALVS